MARNALGLTGAVAVVAAVATGAAALGVPGWGDGVVPAASSSAAPPTATTTPIAEPTTSELLPAPVAPYGTADSRGIRGRSETGASGDPWPGEGLYW